MKNLSLNIFLISFLAAFLIASSPQVSALSVENNPITNTIIPDYNQPAKFMLTITGAEEGNYNIYTLTDVKILPQSPFAINGESQTEIYVYPTENLDERGFYSFSYTLKKIGGESFENTLMVKVTDLEDAIEISSDSNDPEKGKINFWIKNKENADLKNIKAKFSSVFFDFEEEFNLEPYELKEFSIKVDSAELKKISAGSYITRAEFKTDRGIKEVNGKIYLGEKKGIQTEEDSSGILIYTDKITKINIGNVPQTVNIKMKKDIISRLFTNFNIEPSSVDRTGFAVSYSWVKELEPAEVFTVRTRTSYIFPVLILILAVILIVIFRRLAKTKIEIKKSVHPVKTKDGQFALRVRLNLKARKSVENVTLNDRIPAIVKIYESFGSVKPDKIDSKNRRIQWSIGNLNAGEERFFSYIIYSKVGVVGKFSLPQATAVYEGAGELHETWSNKVFFLSEQARRDED